MACGSYGRFAWAASPALILKPVDHLSIANSDHSHPTLAGVSEQHLQTPRGFFAAKYSQIAFDLLAVWAAFAAAGLLTEHTVLSNSFRVASFAAISTGLIAWFWAVKGHYSQRRPFWDDLYQVLLGVCVAGLLDAALAFAGKTPFSRLWLGSTWLLVLVFLPATRLMVRRLLKRAGLLTQPCVVVGSGEEVYEAIEALKSEPLMGFEPVAIIRPGNALEQRDSEAQAHDLPEYELTYEVKEQLQKSLGLKVLIVLGDRGGGDSSLRDYAQRLALERDDVYILPAVAGLPLYGMQMFNFFSHEVLLLRVTNNLNRRAARLFKRVFDLLAASLILVLISPFLAWVAWRIRVESPGPALFKQERVGAGNSRFDIYKFRSMVTGADQVLAGWKKENPALYLDYVKNNFKLEHDPRVTRIGKWIRAWSVDELPQLINVLRGEMSLVGPRPLLARELADYGESIDIYSNVRPGITGLWQISGRSNTKFEHRIAMDRWYVRNWSVWHDIVILLRTVSVVLKREGAK
jgi:Undecaprenyl-phosphate galactose phosphotransferase WbaP